MAACPAIDRAPHLPKPLLDLAGRAGRGVILASLVAEILKDRADQRSKSARRPGLPGQRCRHAAIWRNLQEVRFKLLLLRKVDVFYVIGSAFLQHQGDLPFASARKRSMGAMNLSFVRVSQTDSGGRQTPQTLRFLCATTCTPSNMLIHGVRNC